MLVERLCAYLGDPPADVVRLLDERGLHHDNLPVRFGGQFDDFVAPPQSVRAVARRDLTVASVHGKTFPGGVSAWVAQDDAAAQAPAGKALGRHPVFWGLAGRDHESDLLAGEISADVVTGGYRISGEEWLINDATLHRVVRVLARSVRAGEESGFDMQSRDHRIVGTFDGDSTADVHAIINSFPINARRGNAEAGTTSGLSDARPELASVLVLAQQAVCRSNRLLARLAGHRPALPEPSIVDSGDAVLAEFARRRLRAGHSVWPGHTELPRGMVA